jgi:hypothetical protein
MFLSEMPAVQARLETLLEERMASDRELSAAVEQYRAAARAHGDGAPHFGVHFRTNADLERAMSAVRNDLSPALAARVSMTEMPPYGAVADFPDMRQVFLHTDVFAVGPTTFGQTIELQVERAA